MICSRAFRSAARHSRYVAFLRGMNLGNRRIKNDELRRCFEVLDLTDVACFRASGNVIFTSRAGNPAAIINAPRSAASPSGRRCSP